ncbi:jg10595 [Pararge aegeria aegeria]|uniref:Jg10595 protein n=1 Tax=Pararge aegeria aegeria TaxID=348720 RepID=A0A8S4S512_9NEOP|nr:jg10595 [Pararge aegeria aegeria]
METRYKKLAVVTPWPRKARLSVDPDDNKEWDKQNQCSTTVVPSPTRTLDMVIAADDVRTKQRGVFPKERKPVSSLGESAVNRQGIPFLVRVNLLTLKPSHY